MYVEEHQQGGGPARQGGPRLPGFDSIIPSSGQASFATGSRCWLCLPKAHFLHRDLRNSKVCLISVWDDTQRMRRAVVCFPMCWKVLKGSALEMGRWKQDVRLL